MVYETYTCSKDHNMVEWGYCFKQAEGDDDCVLDDLVLGELDAHTPGFAALVEKSWADNEDLARIICDNHKE